jgi:ppGpp synthetase/RelA/SpoT-type nucleotidyltranferase
MQLKKISSRWKKEKIIFGEITKLHEQKLKQISRELGIWTRITSRVKEDTSLLKKIMQSKDMESRYEELSDKGGCRVVCKFREDLPKFAAAIRGKFEVLKEEDKASTLDIDRFGYRSIHFDVSSNFKKEEKFKSEIQLRTLCDDAWAEISHNLNYKKVGPMSDRAQRMIYSLGGLFEIVDNSISSINKSEAQENKLEASAMLSVLEINFIKILQKEFSRDFSIFTLNLMKKYFGKSLNNFRKVINEFCRSEQGKLESILKNRISRERVVPFIGQPEIICIFYLLEKKPYKLVEIWNEAFPISELKILSVWWGKPIDDYLDI